MDLADLLEYSRQQYNSVGDSFFSDAELYRHVWAAQGDLAREALCIERVYTTTTVASQQEYTYPTNTIAIKRVTYGGVKLAPITFLQDDVLTLSNQATSATGTPQYYAIWNETLYLRPIPSTAGTLKIFSYNEPDEVVSGGSLEVPTQYHLGLADYLLWRMAAKDQNYEAANYWRQQWQERVDQAKRAHRKLKRGDSFAMVVDEDAQPITVIGAL